MKTDFVIADEHGRELFKHYCSTQSWCKVIRESKDEYAHWDISYYSGGTMIIGEIKVRESYNSKTFIDWDYEEKKHLNLLNVYEKVKVKPQNKNKKIEIQYINIFKDEAVKIWTTTNKHNEQHPVMEKRPETTKGNTKMVDKSIYKCYSATEANRGTLTPIVYEKQDDDEDDNLPF